MADTLLCSELVERARRWLVGMHGVPLNRLSTDIEDDTTTFAVDYDLALLTDQSYVAIENEIVYVWEVQAGNKEITVSRGQLGTEAADHDQGAMVESMSRFPRPAIRDAIQDEIRSWPDTVFQVKAKNLTLDGAAGVTDLGLRDDAFYWVINVMRSPSGNAGWTQERWVPVTFRVDRKMPRTEFPSGSALVLKSRIEESATARVLYAAPFDIDDIDDNDDVVDSWGLDRSMMDIPPLGAAARLLHAREIQRSDTEAMGETRIPAEVPATYQTQTANALRRIALERISQEAMRLRARYGTPS